MTACLHPVNRSTPNDGGAVVGLAGGEKGVNRFRFGTTARMTLWPIIAVMFVSSCSGVTDDAALNGPSDAGADAAWIDSWLDELNSGTADDPPERIVKYDEPDGTFYFITYGCCDIPSDLLAADGTLLGHPDGGLTGQGDGSTTFEPTTVGIVIWPEG